MPMGLLFCTQSGAEVAGLREDIGSIGDEKLTVINSVVNRVGTQGLEPRTSTMSR